MALNAIFEYERILSTLVPDAPISNANATLTQEYKPVKYWL
jgi:hypothetical protein